MAVKKTNGHAVSGVLPSNSDSSSVASAQVSFNKEPQRRKMVNKKAPTSSSRRMPY